MRVSCPSSLVLVDSSICRLNPEKGSVIPTLKLRAFVALQNAGHTSVALAPCLIQSDNQHAETT